MNILVFSHEFPPVGGGAASALGSLVREWVKEQHAVTVVTTHQGELAFEESVDGAQILRVNCGRKSLFRGRVIEMLRYAFQTWRKASSYYHQTRPDLCVAFFAFPGGLAPLGIQKRHGVPFITELRGGDVPGFLPQSLKGFHFVTGPLIRHIWMRSLRVIANGAGLAELAVRFAPRQAVEVIPNGVDTEFFRPSRHLPAAAGGLLRAVYAGRLVETQKRILTLLLALKGVEGIHLTLVGDGPDLGRCREYVEREHLKDRVEFTGWLSREDLRNRYAESDFYMSASSYEGMSNSALEAMACGLPLVLSDIPGHRELVDEGQNGILFDYQDVSTLREALRYLKASPGSLEAFGQSSRRYAEERHDWKKLAALHLALGARS